MKLLNNTVDVWACSDHEELAFECKLEKLSLEIQVVWGEPPLPKS